MSDLARDPRHLPAETVRLPERGFAIDRRKALIAAALCWIGFAIMVWLVATGQTGGFDRMGLLSARRGAELALVGPSLLLEAVRDVTALGACSCAICSPSRRWRRCCSSSCGARRCSMR